MNLDKVRKADTDDDYSDDDFDDDDDYDYSD